MARKDPVIYLKLEKNVEMDRDDVFLKDLGNVYCSDLTALAKCKALRIHRFSEKTPRRTVLGILKVIEEIEGIVPGISVQNIGETDILIERINRQNTNRFWENIKIVWVCLTAFFGTAFTIMAYHNDIGINSVFVKVYEMCMGRPATGITVLEISYSIGLAVGIILFFNHIGSRRITKDPTPIEVAMRNYEADVNNALIETASREKIEEEDSYE